MARYTDAPFSTCRGNWVKGSSVHGRTTFQLSNGPDQFGGMVASPISILSWLLNAVILARKVLHREAECYSLLVQRVWIPRSMWFSGFGLRICTDYVLGSSSRKQVPWRSCVDIEGASIRHSRVDSALVTVTASMRSFCVYEEAKACNGSTITCPLIRNGACISCSTASATRGSWHNLLTKPFPGLSDATALELAVSGRCNR